MEKYPDLTQHFLKALANDRLSHAYLCYGEKGSGLTEFAKWFAQTLFCLNRKENGACYACTHCHRFEQGDLPDVYHIVPEGATIKIDQLRQLKSSLSFSSMEQALKVVIIDDVDKMSVSAMNSLLKFLEEPEQNIYFFLLTHHKNRVLPTILSRCQLVNFYQNSREDLRYQLQESGVSASLSILLSLLTKDFEVASRLGNDETFQGFVQSVQLFMKYMIQKNTQAFVVSTTQLSEYLTERTYAIMGLDMLMIYLRDVLMYHRGETIYFEQLSADYKNGNIEPGALDVIIMAKQKLEANVSAQNCYDDLCVALLQLKGNKYG